MYAAETIPLSGAWLNDGSPSPVTAVSAALGLLVRRYGLAAQVLHRWPDGSVLPAHTPAEVDDYPLGSLFGAGRGNGPDPVWVELEMQPPGRQQGMLGLTFKAEKTALGLEVRLEGSDAWSHTGIDVRSILGHLKVLLSAAEKEPRQIFGKLDILTPTERRLLLEEYNGRDFQYPAATLHQLFAAQAARTPEAVAIVDGKHALTYSQLDCSSTRVARKIRAHVRAPGQVIAVSGVRSAAMLIVKIGVMKAGGAFMYLPPETPDNRISLLCGIADPCCVISDAATLLRTGSRPYMLFDDLLKDAGDPTAPLEEIASAETAAYVLFTSGSTGEPKGVVRSHRMNTTRIALEHRLYGLGDRDRYLMKAVPFFREVFTPLATGGTVVIARPGGELDDVYLIDLIRRERISICSFVPSMLRVLVANSAFHATPLPIRHLFVAGEVLDAELEGRLRKLGLAVHVTYTLAEADYVSHRSGPPIINTAPADVGRPIDMRLYVCDTKGRLTPPGFPGEFLTGGPGLAEGYLNRPSLTAERFIANPFDPERTPTLFRTGDLGRFRCDGQVEFAGRADSQVKIRGHRMEPTEVEIAIRDEEQVENTLVTSIQDKDQGYLLVAYIVPRSGNLDSKALRTFLEQRLPAYMIPSYFVQVATLPQLASGKLDRAKLRTVVTARPPGLGPVVLPEDEFERCIAGIWSRVLGIADVGLDDTFTALGGDSLRVMLLRQSLESELGISIDLATLLAAETVRELAQHLRSKG